MEPGRKKGSAHESGYNRPEGRPLSFHEPAKFFNRIILIPRRDMPPIEQRQRLLLRISGQDNDPKRRRRRGVSADRRKNLTMMNIS